MSFLECHLKGVDNLERIDLHLGLQWPGAGHGRNGWLIRLSEIRRLIDCFGNELGLFLFDLGGRFLPEHLHLYPQLIGAVSGIAVRIGDL